jgi:hypothetical protein
MFQNPVLWIYLGSKANGNACTPGSNNAKLRGRRAWTRLSVGLLFSSAKLPSLAGALPWCLLLQHCCLPAPAASSVSPGPAPTKYLGLYRTSVFPSQLLSPCGLCCTVPLRSSRTGSSIVTQRRELTCARDANWMRANDIEQEISEEPVQRGKSGTSKPSHCGTSTTRRPFFPACRDSGLLMDDIFGSKQTPSSFPPPPPPPSLRPPSPQL